MRTLRLTLAAAAILALAVGSTGIAVAQDEAAENTEPVEAPAAVSEPPTLSFPTGYLVSVENGRAVLEIRGDGTGMFHDAKLGTGMPFTYAVDGDVYTWLTFSFVNLNASLRSVPNVQPTYRWDYDGERLAFELIGEDWDDHRKTAMSYTFRLIEDPRVVMVAMSDLDVGARILAWRGFVPAAEVGPDTYTSRAEYATPAGRVAAVPIAKGQPITPDLLEPAD